MHNDSSAGSSSRFSFPELALVGITFIWGATFLVVRNAVESTGPLAFVGARFGVACVVGALICCRQLRGITRAEAGAGLLIGFSIFAGYSLQTFGLQSISSSKSAFITAFYVPIVPLLQWLLWRRRPHPGACLGVLLAFLGLLLLAGVDNDIYRIGRGELLTLFGALAIAMEIILISRVSHQLNIARVTIVQLGTASLTAFLFMPLVQEPLPQLTSTFILSAVGLGIASTLIQFVMNWAQKRISATKATLIYAGEPVWAGLVGSLAGERIGLRAGVGAALIILASVVGEWRWRRRQDRAKLSNLPN